MIKIKADIAKTMSFARIENGSPLIRSVVVKNAGETDVEGLRMAIEADPKYMEPMSVEIGRLGAGGRIVVDLPDMKVCRDFLSNLTEICNGSVRFTLSSGDEQLASEVKPVTVLPYDHLELNSDLKELIAAFVLPNHPNVKRLTSQVAGWLHISRSGTAMDGYLQNDKDKVIAQLNALYEIIRRQNICYALPPASFYESGQRVRMPEEIISEKLATCLDSSLLFAGCMEAMGLNPLIVLTNSHAFVGCWLTKSTFPFPVNDDPSALKKKIADGINDIVLFETTTACVDHSESFSDACRIGADKLLDDDFCYFIDVAACRNLGVRPLPLRVLTPQGYVIEESGKPRLDGGEVPSEDAVDLDQPLKFSKHDIWERKLLDLTLRNTLLKVHTHNSAIQLACGDGIELARRFEDGHSFSVQMYPESEVILPIISKGIYGPLKQTDRLYDYCDIEVQTDRLHSFLNDVQTDDRMVQLRKAAKRSLDENGANTLFLTVGALNWFDEDGKGPYTSPIILYPAEFSSGRLVASGEDPMVNMTLLEMLRQKFGITIPGLDPLPEKNGNVDVRLVMNTIRQAVMDRKGWNVDMLCFLGIFTFNKFIIWNDIHSHRELIDSSPIVHSFVSGALEFEDVPPVADGDIDAACPSDKVLLPIGADSSQLRAIADAIGGRSFVMFGPPGTGKSQTITNIIANALYHGKRVLFVSEKKAALEVVQSRLEDIGLAPFCLELHSNKARKSAVLKKMEDTLNISYKSTPSCFAEEAKKQDQFRQELNYHAQSLHKVHKAGLSLYDCLSRYMTLPKEMKTRRVPSGIFAMLTPMGLKDMMSALQDYVTVIRHTGINGDCQLLDMPMAQYTPDYVEGLNEKFSEVLAANGLKLWFKLRKLEEYMGTELGSSLFGGQNQLIKNKVARWSEALDDARNYAIYAKPRSVLYSLGLSFVVETYEAGKLKPEEVVDFFSKSFYKSYGDYILSQCPGLNLFCGDIFESRIDAFRKFDEEFTESVRKEIFDKAAEHLTNIPASMEKEFNLLQKAIGNKGRGMSLRSLFERTPNILPHICPCMLMSPLSVSQYIQPENGKFDLVIFDEASQLPTSEAVAAIARGNSVVVVGDPNQLPPTSFFEVATFDEEHFDIEDLDSILDDCLALSMPSNHLVWHYRSRHESLIAFSNASYYDNRLMTFPSIDDLASKVTFQKVEGVYDRGRSRKNVLEAEAVVEDIRRRLSDPELCKQTIGVVTFSVAQQNAIEEKLEDMLRRHTKLWKVANEMAEPIFVKNLESVQGDERDVILFSVGYGVDAKGKVPMNFGPLNQAGGWRRLNVAVSRSRQEMKVFSTILPEQMPKEGLARGVADLRSFLEYAERGREVLEAKTSCQPPRDLLVEKMAEELRQQGLIVNTMIGTSNFRMDIGVVDPVDPQRYLYGIMLDGVNYASAESARDREITRPSVLEGLGWTINRAWILDRI